MRRYGFIVLLCIWVPMAAAGDGSNLGGQATHYEPPQLSGAITYGPDPAAGAALVTTAGQHTLADGNGDYLTVLDAAGIYTVTAGIALNRRMKTVEVFTGTTTELDFDLGTPCPVATWPEESSVLDMVTCQNGNQE